MNGADCRNLGVKAVDGPPESGPAVHEQDVCTSSLEIKGQNLLAEGREDVVNEIAKLTFATALMESFDAPQDLGDVHRSREQ